MSNDPSWPVLSMRERRILGVLVEKAKTTPESYPMSLNALVTGCNQKSNRDPILSLDDSDVEEALEELKRKGLVLCVTGGRVDRWRQQLYEAWTVNKVELAVLAELLLRGPQSVGDLRGRASRMEPIDSLEELRDVLKPLAERRLIIWLSPENRRGALLTHGCHAPEELEGLQRSHSGSGGDELPSPARSYQTPAPTVSNPDRGKLEEALAEIGRLREDLEKLRNEIGRLRTIVAGLQKDLGVNPAG